MCSPTALIATGAIVQGTAGYIGAMQEAQSLKFQSRVAENEARFADIQAEQTAQAGALERSQLLQQTSKEVAANVASTAGSGVDIGGATAREVFESTARVGIADTIQSHINNKRAVWRLRAGAATKRAEAKQLRRAAKTTQLLAPLQFIAPAAQGIAQGSLANKQGSK